MRKTFERRKYIIISIFVFVGLVFSIRLFLLQVPENEYKLSAENNVLRYITLYPPRGLVYDRNGRLLVYNEAAYDLLVVPRQAEIADTNEFCNLLHIERDDLEARMEKARKHSRYKPSVFIEQLSREEYAYLEEKLYKYPGFYVQPRTLRKYPIPIASHVLGYVGEVDNRDLENDAYYKQGDYIGKSGIEKTYEKVLRGSKGLRIIMVDVFNREQGNFQDGKYDTSAVAGTDLVLTLDAELQLYGEELMRNKRGSIVALDPRTGEILALVSSPNYDPNLLIGRIRSKNFLALSRDSLKPLFNRATMAQYPPGSTFKTINALIALDEGLLSTHTRYSCNGVGSRPIPCSHDHESPLDLLHAIEQSCNPYFWEVYKSILEQRKFPVIQDGYMHWRERASGFNIGRPVPGDLPDQRKGNLPADSYFNHYYGVTGWRAITVRSLSIGQGEIEMTPLQLANLSAIIANKGYYLPPHLLRSAPGSPGTTEAFSEKIETGIPEKHFDIIIEGMNLVYEGEMGSARWYRNDSINMCGKTGTSQNPHGKNHSVFIAFAPKENPQIAISCVVENSGYGSTWAAPISTLMMEKYLAGETRKTWFETKMLNANLLEDH